MECDEEVISLVEQEEQQGGPKPRHCTDKAATWISTANSVISFA
jgi:hypothetical protein